MIAADGGDPPKQATATALITIQRNLHAPRFQQQRIDVSILETQPLGVVFADVTALDDDRKAPNNVVRYELLGDERALTYFLLDEVSGELSVRRPLSDDDDDVTSYTVSLSTLSTSYCLETK